MQINEIKRIVTQCFCKNQQLNKINEGVSAEVFEVECGNQRFALKVFRPDIRIEERVKEIEVCQKIKGKFVVKYVCHDIDELQWILFDLFGDANLEELLKVRTLERQQIYFIFTQIIAGYKSVRELGYLHGDMKTNNILVDSQTLEIKICDFGFSTQQTEKNVRPCGSKGYFSPEFFDEVDFMMTEKSEIFSLGIILFKLCFNQFPYTNQSNCIKWMAIKNSNWREFWKNIKYLGEFKQIIEMCLQYCASKRCSLRDIEKILFESEITFHC